MDRVLVITPTYNEKVNIAGIVNSVVSHPGYDILVVDDASPDGTASVVKGLMPHGRVALIERPGKLGLGTAYIAGFKWGLERGYDYLVEMDADGSHDPATLPLFIEEMRKGNDLVIGSRYMNGAISVVGWGFRRLLLSKFGNFYASSVLSLGLTDLTSGFRCYGRRALESIDLDVIRSNGYSFQIEMAYVVAAAGLTLSELPIIFYERASGASKMSKRIIREAILMPWKLRLRRVAGLYGKSASRKKYAKEVSC